MKRLFLVLGLALLVPSLTGCACLCEIGRIPHQVLGPLFHPCGGYGGYGYHGGYGGGCSPCQGGYAPAPHFQGGCSPCGGGYGSYYHGTSHHTPSYGVSTYGCSPCGNSYGTGTPYGANYGSVAPQYGSTGTPTLQSPVMLPPQ